MQEEIVEKNKKIDTTTEQVYIIILFYLIIIYYNIYMYIYIQSVCFTLYNNYNL